MRTDEILLGPVITEKTTDLSDKNNEYGFKVNPKANKVQIKDAVQDMYGVTVEDVRTMRVPGKRKSRYTRQGIFEGMKPPYKKAIVRLTEGDTIDFFSNV
jgi:large subunit ribosomal protein L23